MLNSHTDNASQAMQEAAREGAGQASLIAQISTDVSERAARAGTEILQRHADTVQEALQLSAEIAAHLTERSADQFGRVAAFSARRRTRLRRNRPTILMRSSSRAPSSPRSLRASRENG